MAVQTIKTLGVIPARGGSKSIPRKNIVPVCGKPLIYYTIKSAAKAKLLDACIVSTDDEEIADIARSCGADVPFLRPSGISRDDSTDIEFLRHALLWLRDNRSWEPEIVLNLRPTSPLRTAGDIDAVIELMETTGCDSVRTVIKPQHKPHKMWWLEDEARMRPLMPTEQFETLGTDVPRQLLPQNIYWQTGLVDATRARFILEENKIYGPDIRGLVSDPARSIDLDDPDDLEMLDFIMRKRGYATV